MGRLGSSLDRFYVMLELPDPGRGRTRRDVRNTVIMSQPEFDYLGPYRVVMTLGRGGMGTVYKGVHAKHGEVVAIKVIAVGVANQSRFRRRFEGEIKTLQKLKHPNIVSLRGVGEEQGLLFYTMEFVDGYSLHEHLRRCSRLPWEDVVEIGIQTTAALKHAHDLGIIHRDLKPANLMLNPEGQLKLTDFGIAKLFGSTDMTAAGSVIGTADYMPPEQAEGKSVTVKSDLYSLGAVMYAMLCGKAPFTGKSVPEVLYSVRYNPVPRLEDRVSELPTALAELVHELLDKEPSRRPPTALVVGNRLKALQQGMKKLAISRGGRAGENRDKKGEVGTQLTSLDLSEVDDEELRITSEVDAGSGLSSDRVSRETRATNRSMHVEGLPDESDSEVEEGPGTHNRQTLLAPQKAEALGSREDIPGPGLVARRGRAEADSEEVDVSLDSVSSDTRVALGGGPSHYTPVSADDVKPYSFAIAEEQEPSWGDWIHIASIAGIIVLLLASVGFVVWMVQPRSSDQIYGTILAAVDSGDDASLLSVKDDIDEFLQRFPDDPREAEIHSLSDETELTRWTRVLQRRAAREGGSNELTALEQGFLDCMLARSQDHELAEEKFSAFLMVFGPLQDLTREEKRLVDLVRFAYESGRSVQHVDSVAIAQLEKLIRSAEKSLTGDKLYAYYQNILLLYGDKPWAMGQVQRIRKKLEAEF